MFLFYLFDVFVCIFIYVIVASSGSQTPEDLRLRLAELLRMMPAGDSHRGLIQRLHDQLGQLPRSQANEFDRAFFNLMRIAQQASQPSNGASQRDIDTLPTRTFKAPANAAAAAENKENYSCMVCLCGTYTNIPCNRDNHLGNTHANY